jgi:hypothetical protein
MAVGLHPVASFFCIFAGAALFEAIGMLLAFPLAGSIKVILDRLLRVTSSKKALLACRACHCGTVLHRVDPLARPTSSAVLFSDDRRPPHL